MSEFPLSETQKVVHIENELEHNTIINKGML